MQATDIQPSPGMLLVLLDKKSNTTKGGMFLGEDKQTVPQTGTVAMVGDGIEPSREVYVESPAEQGDRIIYEKFGLNDFVIGESTYRFIKFQSVLGVINIKGDKNAS